MSKYDRLENKIKFLEKRIGRLECQHENVEFVERGLGLYFDIEYGWEICQDCGKTLRTFETEKEFLSAKLEYQKSKCSGDMAETKARLKALKPQSTGLK